MMADLTERGQGATVDATRLRHALAAGELRVHYLPIVDLRAGDVIGVEALLRWERDGEVVVAERFIGTATSTGLIVPIERWTLDVACRHVAEHNRAAPDAAPLRLSVNLSARQLLEPDPAAHVRAALDRSGLDPSLLCLELSETDLATVGGEAPGPLSELKALGVRLSIDDFGTASSSLRALQALGVDELKVDRSLVADMAEDAEVASVVRGVVALARSLGIDTVAEGVEQPVQEQLLRTARCTAAQGWLYAQPGPDAGAVVRAARAAMVPSLERKPLEHTSLWSGVPSVGVAARLVESVFESAPIGMALVDDRGTYLAINPVLADLLGSSEAELAGRSCWEVVHADDLHDDLESLDRLLAGERSSYVVEQRLVDADGRARWVEVTVSGAPIPYQDEGSPRLLRQVRSIDDRRQAIEEAALLRTVLAASPDALVVTDAHGRCTVWNPAAEALLGWPATEMIGEPLTRVVASEERLELARVVARASGGGPVRWTDATWTRADGTEVPVDVTVGPVVAGNGVAVGLVAIARDVSEQRAARTALEGAHRALEARAVELIEANERLGRFAATVSHDLMQPLSALAGFLTLLESRSEAFDDHQRGFLDRAVASKDRMLEAIQALRTHVTVEPIALTEVAVGEVVHAQMAAMEDELTDATVEVAALPVVAGDGGLISRVVANLLQNSVRYQRPEVPLHIEIDAVEEPDGWVVRVTDNGRGIVEAELDDVFQPDVRGSASGGTTGSGTGLATVRSIMQRLGGDVWAEALSPGARLCLRFCPVPASGR